MNRGDVRHYTFKQPDKRRPVLILTRDSILPKLETVTIAPLTRTIRGVPSEVVLTEIDGMPHSCAINLHNLQTVQKSKVGALVTHLSSGRMNQVKAALFFALGFN